MMSETRITLAELALIASTRAALGIGLGLLVADRLGADKRKAVGWTLLTIGALSTIPLAFEVLGGSRPAIDEEWTGQPEHGARTRTPWQRLMVR